VAAYRERYGRADPRDPIGREPAAPEARADWHAARASLGIPAQRSAVSGASTGDLWARRARYEREIEWAPPHVGVDLRATALARREHTTEATLTRAQAQAVVGEDRAELLARAQAHQQLADSLDLREAILADVDAQRARWHDATAQARADAQEATAELRRRVPDVGPLPLHDPAPPRERARAQLEPAPQQGALGQAQRDAAGADLRHAADMAELARRTLDARQAQTQRDAEREELRQHDEPAPARWPQRDPGYQFAAMQRRQAERTAAELAAQDFPAGPQPGTRPDRPAAHYERPPRRSREAERDEPEATL
jgi:hypothetical protein